MVSLARVLGVLFLIFGIALFIKPVIWNQYLSFISKGKRFYTTGIIKLTYGIIFLLAAPQAKIFWIVGLLGMEGFIKGILGILLFRFKPEMIDSVKTWSLDKPRVIAVLVIVFNLVLLASL